jgi:hypothetical protein
MVEEIKLEKESLCLDCEHLFVATAQGEKPELFTRSVCLKDKDLFDHLWNMAQDVFLEKKNDASIPHIIECSQYSGE